MKKWLLCAMMLSVLLISGCGSGNKGSSTYTPPEGVELLYVSPVHHVIAGGIRPVFHNSGDKAVKNITLAVRAYDRNGLPMDNYHNDAYTEFPYNSINLIPGAYSGFDENNTHVIKTKTDEKDIVYVEGAISAIEYTDGSVWESDALDAWLKQTDETFSVEGRKAEIAQMEEFANAAKETPYITLSTKVKKDDPWRIFEHDVRVKDSGESIIESFTIYNLLFDKNGYPVYVDYYGHEIAENCYINELSDINLKPGDFGTATVEGPIHFEFDSAMSVVAEIEFKNGDTWTNPYLLHWQLYYGEVPGK